MALFVIADLHLSHSSDKPMDVFGAKWENHTEKIYNNWQAVVGENDTVVVPGDISWGMNFGNTAEDLEFVNSLNGKKIIGKGNHDFWWQTMRKLNAYKKENSLDTIAFLYNNAFVCDDFIVCGSRGWMISENYSDEDMLIVKREAGRLRLSIGEALKLKEANPEKEIIVFMHYPPAYGSLVCEQFAEVFREYNINRCFYGHLHGVKSESLASHIGDTRLYCISSDYIGFKPMKINQLAF